MSYLYALIPAGIVSAIYIIRKLREFQWGWVHTNYSLQDKIFIITGANTGLGFETAKALVARNATVIMACRSLEKANQSVVAIRQKTANGVIVVMKLDLSSFDSIEKFANEIRTKYPKFNCLINNAGLATKENQVTEDNFEIHFGVNHLGHFLLVNLLKDVIKENSARIVVVSSLMHKRGRIDFDTMSKSQNTPMTSRMNPLYNDSKLMNVYFTRELYKRGYDAHVLCPGLCHTDFFRDYNPKWYHYILFSPIAWLFLRSAEQGAQNIIHCATDNENTETKNPATGYLIVNLKQKKSTVNFDDSISERLWEESAKLCALTD